MSNNAGRRCAGSVRRCLPLQPRCSDIVSYTLQVQKGRDDVMLEFPADDTAGGDHEDALCEMSFHVPKESDRFGGEETVSAAEVRRRLHCTA